MSEQEMIARLRAAADYKTRISGERRPNDEVLVRRGDLDAILTTLASRTPEGMVMVPREPTEAMLDAGVSVLPEFAWETVDDGVHVRAAWLAMLSATPSGAE